MSRNVEPFRKKFIPGWRCAAAPRISGGASRDGVFERVAAGGGGGGAWWCLRAGGLDWHSHSRVVPTFQVLDIAAHRSRAAPRIPIFLPTFNTSRFARICIFSRPVLFAGWGVDEAFWWQGVNTYRPLQ